MATLNTTRAKCVAQLFNPKNGRTRAVRTDGTTLYRDPFTGGWKLRGKLKPGVTPEAYIAKMNELGYRPYKRGDVPGMARIWEMERDGIAEATDGCMGIEPDGRCSHGCKAWPDAILSMGR